MEQFPGYLFQPTTDIKHALLKAVEHFENTFSNKPTKIIIPELKYALEIWESKLLESGIPSIQEAIAGPEQKDSSLFHEFVKSVCRRSEHTLPAIYYAAIERREMDSEYLKFIAMFDSLKAKLDAILADDGIILLPTHPEPAPHHLLTIPKYPNQAYTCIFNVLGYPATQVPAGLSRGLPIGVQVIGAINNDSLCITAAMELDKVFGGWKSPCEICV